MEGKTVTCHLIAMYVTIEQESAIRQLFSERGWTYQLEDLSAELRKVAADARTTEVASTDLHDPTGATVNYYEVEVVQGCNESDNETTDYDGESLLSQLMETSQAVENENAGNVKVELLHNGNAYVISNPVCQETEMNRTTEIVENTYAGVPLDGKNVVEDHDNLMGIGLDKSDYRKYDTVEIADDQLVKRDNDKSSKSEPIKIDDNLDIEQKVKLSTIEEFDDLKSNPYVKLEDSKESLSNDTNLNGIVRTRGRPKKKMDSQVKGDTKKRGRPPKQKKNVNPKKSKKDSECDEKPEKVKTEHAKDKAESFIEVKVEKEEADDNEKSENEGNQKKKEKIVSLAEYKKMVEVWDKSRVYDKPETFKAEVHYGYFLKPINKPEDLDSDFFSSINNGYFCTNCSLLIRNKIKFIKHRVRTDGKCFYECDLCGKRFMVRSEMANHRKYHTKDRPFACHLCNGRYSRRHTLNLHIQQNHQHQNPYMCYICGKLFKIRPCLLRHLKFGHIHESEKMALCSQCPKRFKSDHDLKAHLRTHLTEKEWACDVCSKLFKTRKYMREHRKIHFQERVQICEVCGKGFFKLEHLKNHSLLHSGLKPYACTICTYKCTVKCNLQKHMKIHLK